MDFDVSKVTTAKGGVVSIHNTIATEKMPLPVGTLCYNTNIWGINGYYSQEDLGDEVWSLMNQIEFKARTARGSSPRALEAKERCVELLKEVLALRPSGFIVFAEDKKEETPPVEATSTVDSDVKALATSVIDRIKKFLCPAFGMESSSIRMISTLAGMTEPEKIKNYCISYLQVSGNDAASELEAQMESDEFQRICLDFAKLPAPAKDVNKRLTIYYGPPGTGKTYTALNNNPGSRVMVCSSTMDPSDLVEVFDFNDENGNPVFKLSPLGLAMTEGKACILDEINLLPRECCTVLQGYLDNKSEVVTPRGKKIEIKDGFEIIGTMNLSVDGQIYSLPTPLVDRCKEMKEFKLTTDKLVDLIYN